jgi:hypothetical protein
MSLPASGNWLAARFRRLARSTAKRLGGRPCGSTAVLLMGLQAEGAYAETFGGEKQTRNVRGFGGIAVNVYGRGGAVNGPKGLTGAKATNRAVWGAGRVRARHRGGAWGPARPRIAAWGHEIGAGMVIIELFISTDVCFFPRPLSGCFRSPRYGQRRMCSVRPRAATLRARRALPLQRFLHRRLAVRTMGRACLALLICSAGCLAHN